jgi:malonyl-CoA/methylmalonyl-CoA synthetase
MLFPPLTDAGPRPAIRIGDQRLDFGDLQRVAANAAAQIGGAGRVAVWATPTLHTCAALFGALAAGVPAVPLSPKSGTRELEHMVADAAPDLLLADPGTELPPQVEALPRAAVDLEAGGGSLPSEPPEETPALVVYTSGTTGLPKGVVLSRRAIAANIDALAAAWEWTADDALVHALPLFHVHGLVLGLLGPIRLGGQIRHLQSFSAAAVADALEEGATMLFGVPTMYHRLAREAEDDARVAGALRRARLLVSGSAALPAVEHQRIERICGQRVVERYGMTETLMICSVRADGDRRPGYVGLPLDGVEIALLDDERRPLDAFDDETIGEVAVRSPSLFSEYLNQPEATAGALREGWFITGDLGTRANDGYLRLLGRRSTDLIKSGGFKIGAGEIEGALLEHPSVLEAAVTGEPDPDLGERVVAWIVSPPGETADARELTDHVAKLLSPHKRPRDVHFLAELPRNAMGKVRKTELTVESSAAGDA